MNGYFAWTTQQGFGVLVPAEVVSSLDLKTVG